MDEIHFRPAVNRYMCECFANGECEVKNEAEMEECLTNVRDIIEGFDFEKVLK